jgi:hypothetical protein
MMQDGGRQRASLIPAGLKGFSLVLTIWLNSLSPYTAPDRPADGAMTFLFDHFCPAEATHQPKDQGNDLTNNAVVIEHGKFSPLSVTSVTVH